MLPNFTVIYDACVLFPNVLRDLLMELAMRDLYRAKWTNEIHDEWIRNVHQRKGIPLDKLNRIKEKMNEHVRDCLVTDYHWIIPNLNLPDPGDRHVLAAAIKAQRVRADRRLRRLANRRFARTGNCYCQLEGFSQFRVRKTRYRSAAPRYIY